MGSWRLPKVREQVSIKAKLQTQVCSTLKSTFLSPKTLNPSVLWLPHLQYEGAVSGGHLVPSTISKF